MVLFGIATVAVLILAWVWGSRGFFSALLHMLCVIVAGAIAFGLWEVVGYALLGAAGNRKWLIDITWGIALAVPFAATLAVLRLGLDKLLPFNTDLDGTSNLVGGIACGAVSGVLTGGIMITVITNCRIGTESLAYDMVDYDTNGSMVKQSGMETIYPRITAGFYKYLSENSLRTETPMAVWRPDIAYEGSLLRTNFNAGTSRLAIPPNSFDFIKRYTVGLKASGLTIKSFLGEGQTVTPFSGEAPLSASDTNHYLEGYVVKFKNAAREVDGRIVIGNAQVQLVVRSPDDTESRTLFPVGMISQAEILEGDDSLRYWRWGFGSARTFISSVGGADDPPMAFEFLVAKGWRPLALTVKGVRVDVTDVAQPKDYADTKARLEAVKDYDVVALPVGAKPATRRQYPREEGVQLRATAYQVDGRTANTPESPIAMLDTVPFGIIMSADNKGSLVTTDGNMIVEGEAAFRNTDLAEGRSVDSKLQVRRFASDDNTKIVLVNISNDSPIAYSKNKIALQSQGAPLLVDNLGQKYSAIGYVYRDSINTRIRIAPGAPIGTIADLPDGGPSESRGDQRFVLVYRVTTNVKIKSLEIGGTVVVKVEPNMDVKK